MNEAGFTIVDVFAERPLEGNPLAVVRSNSALADEQMQRIAQEFNLSETSFVTDATASEANVRIFTPAEELPFAGHPTLGTAWVLAGGRGQFSLNLPAGRVPVRFSDGLAWMIPPEPALKTVVQRQLAASLVGLEEDQLDPEFEPRIVHCGADYCIVPLRSLTALERIQVSGAAIDGIAPQLAVFAFSRQTYSTAADWSARTYFFDGHHMREDPATGSANAGFAAYLGRRGSLGRIVVEQGVGMGRPSRLYLHIGGKLEIGGRVSAVAEGRLLI
jgi:trans-2,3-dihydro-3-hydroxyanthranilate isomerase